MVRLREVPTITSVAVTSTPSLMSGGSTTADTYGAGEDIEFTVTFSEAVMVTGDPQFGFNLSGRRTADYDADESNSTQVVFVYIVQPGDTDNDGIWFGNHDTDNPTLRLDSNDAIQSDDGVTDANLEHPPGGRQSGHKVDGLQTADEPPEDPVVVAESEPQHPGRGRRARHGDGDGVAVLGDRLHGDGVGEGAVPGDGCRLHAEPEP